VINHGEDGQDCVIAAFCNEAVTAEADVNGLQIRSFPESAKWITHVADRRVVLVSRPRQELRSESRINNDGRFDAVASRRLVVSIIALALAPPDAMAKSCKWNCVGERNRIGRSRSD
jgi:hypothetical protein